MATEKKSAAEEAGIKEVTEEVTEEAVTEAEEVVEETSVEAEEAAEETAAEAEEVVEEAAAEAEESVEEVVEEAPVKVSSKRIKKAERREAKAARKAANKIEEKKSRPNNALIAILIFGVVIAMFAFVLGYNYFSKPATIAKYIEENGGEEAFGNMQVDGYTTAAITADGNSMTIALTADTDDEEAIEQIKEYYSGDEGKEQLEDLTAYFLTGIKPQTRAFSANAKATMTLNGEELNSIEMTYKEAKKMMEEEAEEAEAGADADAEDAEEAGDAAEEAAEDVAEDAEEAAEDAE